MRETGRDDGPRVADIRVRATAWLIIGAIPTVIVAVIAGPLGYLGVNPEFPCHLPSPSS